MIHLTNITVLDNKTYPGSDALKKGFSIKCQDVNLLVGNQGCGKSTLLKLLSANSEALKIDLCKESMVKGVKSFYFDSEADNHRMKDPENYTNPGGSSKGYGYRNAIAARFKSHGEVLEPIVIAPLLTAKDSVILLDEPESGLSITNQFRLIDAIKIAVENNCQLFIATHCYPLIMAFNDVVSLEHKKQMTSAEFIKKASKI